MFEEQASYSTAKEKVIEQIVPANFVCLASFHKRTLRPGESLSVFIYESKQLLEQALLTADVSTSKQLLATASAYQWIAKKPKYTTTSCRPN